MRVGRTLLSAAALLSLAGASPEGSEICRNATGMRDGLFHTFWKDGGEASMTLAPGGRYVVRYRLGAGQNLVVGRGWRSGSAERRVRYRATAFEAGSNSYLALYGWSTDPLVEYYVVESWGRDFTPPGPAARAIGTVTSDGGTYAIYRTRRIAQPSIRGRQSFDQYWSVRTTRRSAGGVATISVANHVAAWRALGMRLGSLDYQVLATEGFGSTGAADVTVTAD
jgi:endo-1,4-beta-xylanase